MKKQFKTVVIASAGLAALGTAAYAETPAQAPPPVANPGSCAI